MNPPPIDDLWSQVGLLINDLLPFFPPGVVLGLLAWVAKHFKVFKRLAAIGMAAAGERKPAHTPTNGNGNGQYTLLSQALDGQSNYTKSLDKRLDDHIERIEEWRQEEHRYREERESSWQIAYHDQVKQKNALAAKIEQYDKTLKRIDKTILDHESRMNSQDEQIALVKEQSTENGAKLNAVEATTNTILEIVRRLENKAA